METAEPVMVIPITLVTSIRKTLMSKGWEIPCPSDNNLTTPGPQRDNTGRGSCGDNMSVRRAFRCCGDWNLAYRRVIMTARIKKQRLPPSQSDLSHECENDSRKSPRKERSQKVEYSIAKHVLIEFALCGTLDGSHKHSCSYC